jgi:hypothetical protein
MNIEPADVVANRIDLFGGRSAIESRHCTPKPIGCGRQLSEQEIRSWDPLSQKEYTQSGWCRNCQDKFFNQDAETFSPDRELEACTHEGKCEDFRDLAAQGHKIYGQDGECICTCDNPCCEVDVGGDDVGAWILTCESQHCRVHGEKAQDV